MGSYNPQSVADPWAVPYTIALCNAIEHFTAGRTRTDPRAFHYRKHDLRYAIERWFYFSFVNDESLYAHYKRIAAGERADADLAPMAALIARYLDVNAEPPPATPSRTRRSLVTLARTALSINRRRSLDMFHTEFGVTRGAILFHVGQRKFVPYLSPIIKGLGLPFAFLVIDDLDLCEWLRAQSYSVVHVRPDFSSSPRGRLTNTMKSWNWLASVADVIQDALSKIQSRCIVVAEGNSPFHELLNRVAQRSAIPVLCIQQGWSPIIHSGFRNMTYSAMCVWGKGFADLLRPYNPAQSFALTGNHIVRLADPTDAASRSAIGFFAQKGARIIGAQAWAEFLDFIRWTTLTFPKIDVLVREHPGSPFSDDDLSRMGDASNLKLTPPSATSLNELLEKCRIVVSVFSTTLLEGLAAGAVPFVLNVTGMNHYVPNIAAANAGVEVRDFGAARERLSQLLGNPDRIARFAPGILNMREAFFAYDERTAKQRIIRLITSAASSTELNWRPIH